MSRIGNKPVKILEGVEVNLKGRKISVKGKLGNLEFNIPSGINVKIEEGNIIVSREKDIKSREKDIKELKSLHGTVRAIIYNMVKGVSEGFRKSLEVNGVGYRVLLKGKELQIEVGFSRPIIYSLPDGITAKVEKNVIHLESYDKVKLGEVAAEIRRIRPAEPYKGKGIKYLDEHIRRKAGKSQVGAK